MKITELLVNRGDLRETRIGVREAAELAPGEVLLEVEKFALTANNISYAVTGDSLGYWGFFPSDAPWGKVPVWGFARVVRSASPELAEGARIWGFLPMASHVVMRPQRRGSGVVDASAHRAELPGLYNAYMRTEADPPMLAQFEDARCIFLPLFATSFIVADYYADNGYFGAQTVIIGSASSKTGYGTAGMLRQQAGAPRVVGLTSPRNIGFVESLGFFDAVVAYDAIEQMAADGPVGYIDMAGDGAVTARVHRHFGEAVVASTLVGATHWEASRTRETLPGVAPQFFFAPAQFGKREAEWGQGEPMRRASMASLQMVMGLGAKVRIEQVAGPEPVQAAYLAMLEGTTNPDVAYMLRFQAG